MELAAARSMLRQVIALADEAPALPDDQLRDWLLALADRARPAQRPIVEDPVGVTVPR